MATNRSDLEVRITGRDDLTPRFDALESRLIRFVGAIGAGIAAIRIGTAPIASAVNFERELANVRKTTNFLSGDMNRLSKELLAMSTRIDVSALDLAKIAAAAGQQGLGREGVEGVVQFTESVSRMASVLDITAEQAAEDIGKIANIFKIPLRDIEQAVSSFNEVSNNSTAKGEELLDVVKRIGDAAGNLNLSQSLALASTGLDFGQSPEVVGTAFAKVFTSLTQRANDFGRLLYGNMQGATEQWLTLLQSDGLKGFQAVLAKLRTLQPQAQQDTIVKLFGGGRIGALLNKLVQDTTDSVLERNYRSAVTGEAGVSAIREQATVLNTFKAQAILTLNTLTKAGIEATNALLPTLTRYVRELREVLDSQDLQSFFNALAQAFGVTLDVLIRLIKGVASLNINWENFVNVAAVFTGLALAKVVGALVLSITGLGTALKSISNSSAEAKKGLDSVGAAAKKSTAAVAAANNSNKFSRAAELLGYKELYTAITKSGEAKKKAAEDAKALQSKQAADLVNQASIQSAGAASRASIDLARERSEEVRKARGSVFRAQQQAAQEEQNLQAQKQVRLQASETAHQARLAAIEANYQTRRAAIRATGTETGLKALREERAAAIAAETATQQRSISGIERYWQRRIATAAAGSKAAIDAERLAYLGAAQRFDASITAAQGNKDRFARVGGQSATPSISGFPTQAAVDAVKAQAALSAVTVTATTQVGVVARLQAAWGTFALTMRTVASVLVTVGGLLVRLAGLLANVFFVATILYTIADALGVMEKVAPAFQRLTDALGLTSEAERKQKVLVEAARKAEEERKKAIQDTTQAYRDLAEVRDTETFAKDVGSFATQAGAADTQGARVDALNKLLAITKGAMVQLEQQTKVVDTGIRASLTATEKEAAAALARYEQLQTELTNKLKQPGANTEVIKAEFEPRIRAAVTAYAALAKVLDETRVSAAASQAGLDLTSKNAQAASDAVRSLFTPQSAQLLEAYGGNLQKVYTEIAKVREQYAQLISTRTNENENAVNSAAALLEDQIKGLQSNADSIRAALGNAIGAMKNLPNISDNVKKSLDDLLAFTKLPSDQFAVIANILKNSTASQLTGANAGVGSAAAAQGKETFNTKVTGQESLARRLARANIELAKAENDSQQNLTAEYLKQNQALEDAAFDKGLRSLADYYANRERIQVAGIDAEITRRKLDLKAVEQEATKPGLDVAEKTRLNAERVRLLGQIDVLVAQKEGVRADLRNDISVAQEAFNLSVLSEGNKLSADGFFPPDFIGQFENNFKELTERAKAQLAKLRTEGKGSIADALEKSFAVEAAGAVYAGVSSRVSAAFADLNQVRDNINRLRDAGVITSAEADDRLTTAINNAKPAINGLITASETLLDSLRGTSVEGSVGFVQLQQSVDGLRSTFRGLQGDVNTTAKEINKGISSALQESLGSARFNFGGVDDFILDFALRVRSGLKAAFTKNLSETIAVKLGIDGEGGIGGALASVFGVGGKKRDGSSPNTALYVTTAVGPLDGKGDTPSIESFTNKAMESLTGWFDSLKGTFGDLFDSLSSNFGSWFDSIMGLFSGGGGGGGGLGSLLTTLVGFFHTGGIVGSGSGKMRVSPAVFANAMRYHTGGIAGLKPNEVPIIAKNGEEVLTPDDPRHRYNLAKGSPAASEGGSSGMVNVWVVTPDQQPAMGPTDVVAIVGDNISRGGSIKKLVQQVQMGR